MEKVEYLWEKYNKYKETAEQHEFVRLFMLDARLIPAYNDLHTNYNKEHAEAFTRVMTKVLKSFGVEIKGDDVNE